MLESNSQSWKKLIYCRVTKIQTWKSVWNLFLNIYRDPGTSTGDDRLEYYIPLRGPLPPSKLPVDSPDTPATSKIPGHRTIQLNSFPKKPRRLSAPARLYLSRYYFKSFPLKSCHRFQLYWRLFRKLKVKIYERKNFYLKSTKRTVKYPLNCAWNFFI